MACPEIHSFHHQDWDFVLGGSRSQCLNAQPDAEEAALGAMAAAMMVYALVVLSYFLSTGGKIYVINPPSVGFMTDKHGCQRPSFLGPQSNWTTYYGRIGVQLPTYKRRFRFLNPGPIKCTKHSKTQ